MKKLIALTLCTLTAFSITACGTTSTASSAATDTSSITSVINDPVNPGNSSKTATDSETTPSTLSSNTTESTEDLVDIPNPFIDCDSLEVAEKIAGFEIRVPDSIDGYSDRLIQAIDQYLIQVFYYAPSEKSKDTENAAVSESTEITQTDGNAALGDDNRDQLLLRKALGTDDISGDYNAYSEEQSLSINNTDVTLRGDDGKIYVITWTDGTYSYAIDSDAGLDLDTAKDLVTQLQ